ncbi:hypothetical protein [Chloroflexus sp.]|uniref:hypothetical protein n=1 Tax=Chloroflexus sp. TaxID=1904827 RepID=UPI00404A380D
MNQSHIQVITEGATERVVGQELHKKGILSPQARPKLMGEKRSREGYETVINYLRKIVPDLEGKVLLMFDREGSPNPMVRRDKIESDLSVSQGFFIPIHPWANVFEHRQDNLHIVLHISDGIAPNIGNRGDFDGYILQLLQGRHKNTIAQALLGDHQQVNQNDILNKAEQEITDLMKRNHYPWQTAKAWLYAYITVFQFRQSHVWFAKRVVKVSPEDELKRVFASLIAAWDRLIF